MRVTRCPGMPPGRGRNLPRISVSKARTIYCGRRRAIFARAPTGSQTSHREITKPKPSSHATHRLGAPRGEVTAVPSGLHGEGRDLAGRRFDDPVTSEVVGGLLGRTYLGLLTVERFFLPEDLRRNRICGKILAMAEEEGRHRGCTRAALSTLHFQAPGFYLKQGWEVAAGIECEPPGNTRFYMTKKLG
jgi:hypothetical protein